MSPLRLGGVLVGLALAGCASMPSPPQAASAAPGAAVAAAPLRLRLIAFNDFHGHLEQGTLTLTVPDPERPGTTMRVPAGGAAALAGMLDGLRAGAAHSLVISSGDQFGAAPLVSSLFQHESTVEVLNQLGLNVAAVGNHELDAGLKEFQRVLAGGCAPNSAQAVVRSCALGHDYAGAKFVAVAANIEDSQGRTVFAPAWVGQLGPVKVGVIGAVTRTTPNIVSPSGILGLRFIDEAEAINRTARQLKAQGVDLLVATMHEGGDLTGASADWNDPACPGFKGPMVDIAARIVPEVDVLFTGHTHQGYNCRMAGRPVVQAVSYGRGVSVVDFAVDPATGKLDRTQVHSRNLPVLNGRASPEMRAAVASGERADLAAVVRQATEKPEMVKMVQGYSAAAAPQAQREVGRITATFDRKGKADWAAGRLIADAQLAFTRAPAQGGAQLALMNPGGVRADLLCRGTPPCVVTFDDVFSMQPFGNSLVVMTLSGAQLRALLEAQYRPVGSAPSIMSPSAGLSYRWVASAGAGARVQNLMLNGEPIVPGRDYRVTVNNFMADGGDGHSLLRQGRDRLAGGQDLDALLAWLNGAPVAVPPPRVEWVE